MLLELAQRHGIEAGYHDIWGIWHALSTHTAQALLGALGVDTSSEEKLVQALADCEERPWREFAPRVVVNRDEQPCEVMLTINACHDQRIVHWRIECEDDALLSGEQQCAQLDVHDERVLNGATLRRRRLVLPGESSHGYHRLHIEIADHKAIVALIRTPARCTDVVDERVWGLCVQLYGLRSTSNWGIGDFDDLRLAIQIFASRGADFIGLNPLHALYLDTPTHISPYSPSSREHTNALYLHIESMADYADCEPARTMVEAVEFQATLTSLRQCELVDYVGVAACKRPVFECLFEYFAHAHFDIDTGKTRTARGHEFAMFCDVRGEDLHRFAVYEALHEHFGHRHTDGQAWPVEYGDSESLAMTQFVASHTRRIAYFQYLQWQCETQLTNCREHAISVGMRIGLYLDLAVGSDGRGADVCSEPEYYAARVSIGAPADDFALQGQVWGLPPLRADRLCDSAYEPFIRCLRANMRHAGALRIDHVLGLLRLFWVPGGGAAVDGAYVHYPVDDLLAITALESERAQCVVVGEDLGTVPDAMREALARFAVLSYRVFYFEKHWHGDHSFRAPQHYPREALVTLTTHDLPTIIGYWTGRDLDVRHSLGLFSSEQFEAEQRATRALDRARILGVLRDEDLWPRRDETRGSALFLPGDKELLAGAPPPRALVEAIYRLLARCNSLLLSVQMEDALGVAAQVNVPGTVTEQPNWQRKLPLDIEQWQQHAGLTSLCAAIAAER